MFLYALRGDTRPGYISWGGGGRFGGLWDCCAKRALAPRPRPRRPSARRSSWRPSATTPRPAGTACRAPRGVSGLLSPSSALPHASLCHSRSQTLAQVERRYKQERGAQRSEGASLRDVTLCQEQLQMGTAYDIQAYRLLAPGESQYDEDEAT